MEHRRGRGGAGAAIALEAGRDPTGMHADTTLRRAFPRRLVTDGVPLYWLTDVGVGHPAFTALQMAAVTGEIEGSPESLEAGALPPAVRRRLGV